MSFENYAFDIYPYDDPVDGTRLCRLTPEEGIELAFRDPEQGFSMADGIIRIHSLHALCTAANFHEHNLVKIVALVDGGEVDTDKGFFLEEGEFDAVSTDEAGGRDLTFTGPNTVYYLERAVLREEPFSTEPEAGTVRGSEDVDGMWTWIDDGSGVNAEPGGIMVRGLEEGRDQPGNPLADASWDFTRFTDSNSVGWTAQASHWQFRWGTTILELLKAMLSAGLHWRSGANLNYSAYATDPAVDRSSATFAAGKVRFEHGVNFANTVRRRLSPSRERSAVLVGGQNNVTAFVTGGSSDVPWVGYVDAGSSADATTLNQIGETDMDQREVEAESAFPVRHIVGDDEAAGLYIPFVHYVPGDIVTLHTGTAAHDFNEFAIPVAAVRILHDEAGNWFGMPELGAQAIGFESRAFETEVNRIVRQAGGLQLCRDVAGTEAIETFTRTEASGGGTSEITPFVFTHPSGTTGLSVDGDELVHVNTGSTVESLLEGLNGTLPWEHEVHFRMDRAVTGVGQVLESGLFGPDYNTLTDWATAQVTINTSDVASFFISGSAGSDSIALGAAGTDWVMKLRIESGQVRGKLWESGDTEPDWQVTVAGDMSGLSGTNDFEIAGSAGNASNATRVDTVRIISGHEGSEGGSVCITGGPNATAGDPTEACAACAAPGNHDHDSVDNGDAAGGDLAGTYPNPTVASTHSGSAHHSEDHASRHANGGADELDVVGLAAAETDTDLRLAPDGAGGVEWAATAGGSALTIEDEGTPLATAATSLDFVGAGVVASGTGATKTITISGAAVADILDLPTAEMDDTLVLAPDGAGGVEFRAEAGGGSSDAHEVLSTVLVDATATGDAGNRADHFLGASLDAAWVGEATALSAGPTVAYSALAFRGPSSGAHHRLRAFTPSGAFRVEMRVNAYTPSGKGVGLLVRDSGTGDASGNGMLIDFTNGTVFAYSLDTGTYTSRGSNTDVPWGTSITEVWLALERNGSNQWTAQASIDRVVWRTVVANHSKTFTVAKVGARITSTVLGYIDLFDVVS